MFIAQSSESFSASSTEQFYVSISRGRKNATIYTDDRVELKQAVADSSVRLSATELVKTSQEKIKEHSILVNRLKSYSDSVMSYTKFAADRTKDVVNSFVDRIGRQNDLEPEIGR